MNLALAQVYTCREQLAGSAPVAIQAFATIARVNTIGVSIVGCVWLLNMLEIHLQEVLTRSRTQSSCHIVATQLTKPSNLCFSMALQCCDCHQSYVHLHVKVNNKLTRCQLAHNRLDLPNLKAVGGGSETAGILGHSQACTDAACA
jgi:hypothetical protein